MKKTLLGAVGLLMLLALLGCETLKGFGRDIENTGGNILDLVTGADKKPSS